LKVAASLIEQGLKVSVRLIAQGLEVTACLTTQGLRVTVCLVTHVAGTRTFSRCGERSRQRDPVL